MKNKFLYLLTLLFFTTTLMAKSYFVTIGQSGLKLEGKPYVFMGANFWQGMNMAMEGDQGKRDQLLRELDLMHEKGIKQLRILALSEGPATEPYRVVPVVQTSPTQINPKVLVGLDFLLTQLSKRKMTAVICLSNFWPWSGGFAQWVSWFEGSSIPYPPPHPGGTWSGFQAYSSRFYTLPKAIKAQQASVKKIVTRRNSITGILYSEDPTIMAWELANEPRGGAYRKEFLAWIKSSAALIKSLDKNHLVTLGSEGETLDPLEAGNNFIEDHSIKEIDYATLHIWIENWGVYNPKNPETFPYATEIMKKYLEDHVTKSKILKKPLILEEFGIARDQRSMDPKSSTMDRDKYFQEVFKESLGHIQKLNLSGVNFWAWSGESQPKIPYGSLWTLGDDLLGDPPHEEQGWYGVYATDYSTLDLIKYYSEKFQGKRY